jgi:hypothetical protein
MNKQKFNFLICYRFQIMQMCWQEDQFRPPMATVHNLLTHLLQATTNTSTTTAPASSDDMPSANFELRWHALQQTRPAVLNLDPSYDLHPSLCFESDFNFVAMKDQVIGHPAAGLEQLSEEETPKKSSFQEMKTPREEPDERRYFQALK